MSARGAEAPASTWRDWGWLALAVAIAYLLTGHHPALSSSTRYDEACREMVELGDWIVPHLGYVPYLEKPILTYWLGAAAQWAFGTGPYAAHLPSALAAWVSCVATYVIGVAWRGRAFGLGAALLLLGSGYFLAMASVLTTDPILSAALAVCWAGFAVWEKAGRTGRGIWAFWIGLGLGMLAKGPIAIVLPGVAIAGYALLAKGPLEVLRLLWAMAPLRGTAILLAINLPWSLAVWQRDPRLLEFFYVRINYDAFFDPTVNHPGPWWYYLPLVAGCLAPFTVIGLPLLLQQLVGTGIAVVRRRAVEPMSLLLASIVVFPLVFLSISTSKLGTYLMPLLPIFALVVAEGVRALPSSARWPRWLLIGQAVVAAGVVGVAGFLATGLRPGATRLQILGQSIDLSRFNLDYLPLALVILVVLGTGTVVAARWHRLSWSMASLGLTGLAVVALALPRVHQAVPDFDNTRLAQRILAVDPAAPVILQTAVAHDFEILLTLRRRVAHVGAVRELGLGHWCQIRTEPLPAKGQPLSDPYRVSGDTLPGSPWLWSSAELVRRWTGPERLWLIGDRSAREILEKAGLVPIEVDRTRYDALWTNQPVAQP